ncbi:manganese and iron superoxide dismutase [Myriangium duriaei CBS 260.36]|uniref:Manganese and iron superoxide dismutase n=1 Tax=Myriangium duriaei CBS 260.36 TaxID=1168546 RepID=A0A9P4ME60_9PEZI|nr:manganese and iron superoxide dismutase [Myriangium duriaei CBS 260.36]
MATRRIPRTTARALFSPECRPQTQPLRFLPSTTQVRTIFELPQLASHTRWSQRGCIAQLKSDPSQPERSIKLYSPAGYKIAWTVHQSHLLYNLNYITMSDNETQTMTPLEIAKRYARDPAQATLFNYASQAHNNHFYFEALSDRPKPLSEFTGLQGNLVRAFGSVENLRNLMRYTAEGIFGCGYVWLVWVRKGTTDNAGEWKVLATYNAGTPYITRRDGGQDRLQGRDMNNQSLKTAGAFGNSSAFVDRGKPLGAPAEVFPVLALSVWQHSFLRDFSVHGKRQFVEAWWECIDWEKVHERTPGVAKENERWEQVRLQ